MISEAIKRDIAKRYGFESFAGGFSFDPEALSLKVRCTTCGKLFRYEQTSRIIGHQEEKHPEAYEKTNRKLNELVDRLITEAEQKHIEAQ